MRKPYKGFEPKWVTEPAPKGSLRSVFRWGDPDFVKVPKESLYKLMKQTFGLTDEDFKNYSIDPGFETVSLDKPSQMPSEQLAALAAIVGESFVSTADYDRFSVAYGKTGYDARARARGSTLCRTRWFTRRPRNKWRRWSRTARATHCRCMSTAAEAASRAAWSRCGAACP